MAQDGVMKLYLHQVRQHGMETQFILVSLYFRLIWRRIGLPLQSEIGLIIGFQQTMERTGNR